MKRYPPAFRSLLRSNPSRLISRIQDYYATIYSAEIVNTLTNLLFLYLAFRGIHNCLNNDHDGIFLVTFVGYLIVGSGSFLFHATLKCAYNCSNHRLSDTFFSLHGYNAERVIRIIDPMQLVDELSMIYTTCLMFYATFSYDKSRLYGVLLGIGLLSLAIFITLYYHYIQDPLFHQNAYGLLTAIVLFRSMWIMEVNLRPSFKKQRMDQKLATGELRPSDLDHPRDLARQDGRDAQILRTMWVMIACGLSIFLGGFAIWNLDNIFCYKLRTWRREIGLPWGILLEGHGWW